MVLPAALVDHAGLDGEAMFVGCGFTFQIWNPATYKPLENEESRALPGARSQPAAWSSNGGAAMTDVPAPHRPVMLAEVIGALALRDGGLHRRNFWRGRLFRGDTRRGGLPRARYRTGSGSLPSRRGDPGAL